MNFVMKIGTHDCRNDTYFINTGTDSYFFFVLIFLNITSEAKLHHYHVLVGYFGCSGHLCDICFFARYVNKSEFSNCIVVFFIGSRICYLFCQCLCTFTHLYNLQKKNLNLPGMLKQMNRSRSLALHRPHPKHPRTKSLLTLRRTSQLQMKLNTVGL